MQNATYGLGPVESTRRLANSLLSCSRWIIYFIPIQILLFFNIINDCWTASFEEPCTFVKYEKEPLSHL